MRGNVVLCCFQANVMKHSLTHEGGAGQYYMKVTGQDLN